MHAGTKKQPIVPSQYSTKPLERLTGIHLPHVVIQIPVFMEPLATLVMLMVESLEAAIRTYEWQGGSATILVCDDGMQVYTYCIVYTYI